MKSQSAEATKIDRKFQISKLNRAINAKDAKLVKYNDKTKHSYERFFNFATILDFEIKLNLYKIYVMCFINFDFSCRDFFFQFLIVNIH